MDINNTATSTTGVEQNSANAAIFHQALEQLSEEVLQFGGEGGGGGGGSDVARGQRDVGPNHGQGERGWA